MTNESSRKDSPFDGGAGEVCRRLLARFPGRIRGIHLLGSRALGCELDSSDLDLAVVFVGTARPGAAREAQELAADFRRSSPVMLDLMVLDEEEARRGVRPHLKIGRLLAGDDVLRDAPLKPVAEVLGYCAYSALYCSWIIRGRPAVLQHPLAWPDPQGEFYGYERNGIWAGEKAYRPGVSNLLNLVMSVANLRLVAEKGEMVPNKSLVPGRYRELFPDDPRGPLVADTYELCRRRWRGALPEAPDDRRALSALCRPLPDFENEAVNLCVTHLRQFVAADNANLRRRWRGVLKVLRSDAAELAPALAEAGRLLEEPEAAEP